KVFSFFPLYMVVGGGWGVAEFSTCEENEAKAESVKYSIYTKVSDELIICHNCFSAIKAVGRYGQVNLLSGSRKQVQKWNPRHCRTWVCAKFSRATPVCHLLRHASRVANHLTDNIRFRPNLLSHKQFWISAWALRDTVHGFR